MNINNSKFLIVGGAGFVGSNLCHLILEEYDPKEIWIVDNMMSSEITNVVIDPRVRIIYGSITEDSILHQLPVDLEFVFHLSCYHGNQSSIADPIADYKNNTLTSLKLFDAIKGFKKLNKVVYAAAGCAVAEKTYDDAKATPEDAPISLFHDSPYSISKIIGEMYGNFFFQSYDLPFVKARFQNVYGPREILGAGQWRGTPHTVWRNVIPTLIGKSIKGEALPLDNGGTASRDFIFLGDLIRGLVACAEKGLPGEAYNLASGVETSIFDLAKIINTVTENKTPVNVRPAREWDRSGKRFGSTVKSRENLGFSTEVGLVDGLERTIEWTMANRMLIESTIAKHKYFM